MQGHLSSFCHRPKGVPRVKEGCSLVPAQEWVSLCSSATSEVTLEGLSMSAPGGRMIFSSEKISTLQRGGPIKFYLVVCQW